MNNVSKHCTEIKLDYRLFRLWVPSSNLGQISYGCYQQEIYVQL